MKDEREDRDQCQMKVKEMFIKYKSVILKRGNMLKGTGIFVNDDFSSETMHGV